MLGRLRIRQKLAVLLAIPLTAVALVMAALTVDRINRARTYSATAETALAVREVGGLIQTLQQERLLALAYLLIPTLDRSAILRESQAAMDEAARLAAQPRTAAIMEQARWSLMGLDDLRQRVAERTASPVVTYYAYRAAIAGLIQALDLPRLAAADADGLREVLALDALIRSNEEASSSGAILLGTIGGGGFTSVLLRSAIEADVHHLTRFRQLADPSQLGLVDKVIGSEAASRLRSHIDLVLAGGPRRSGDVSDALSAALTYTGLRRLTQDRVARDVAQAARRDATAATTTAVAVAVGVRADICATEVPSLIRLVRAPYQASGVKASEPYASAVQSESNPRSSAVATSSSVLGSGPAPSCPGQAPASSTVPLHGPMPRRNLRHGFEPHQLVGVA